jgi:hypothetical protein
MFGDDQTKAIKQFVPLKFIKDLPMHKMQDDLNTRDIRL